MPANLKMQFSCLQSSDIPEMSKFKEAYLNGFHVRSYLDYLSVYNITIVCFFFTDDL